MRGEAPDPFERILSPSPAPSPSLPSVIGFLNNFSGFFFFPLSAAVETLLLICPGVICLRGVPERIDRVKSRLLTPSVPKHIHSPALLTPSFLCQAADTNWHIGGGREEEAGELGSGRLLSCEPMDRSERRVSLWCELHQQKSEHQQLMNCWAVQMIYTTDLAGTKDHFVAAKALTAEFPLYRIYLCQWWQRFRSWS